MYTIEPNKCWAEPFEEAVLMRYGDHKILQNLPNFITQIIKKIPNFNCHHIIYLNDNVTYIFNKI